MPDYFTKEKIILWSQIFAKKFAAKYQLILKILQIFIFPFNGNESATLSSLCFFEKFDWIVALSTLDLFDFTDSISFNYFSSIVKLC